MPPFSRLKILQCDNDQLYHLIGQATLQLAILGYKDVAMRLVSKMNEHDYFHGQHVVLRPLYLLWDLLGSWPDHEEERARNNIAENRKRRLIIDEQGNSKRSGKQAKVQSQDENVTTADLQAEIESLEEGWMNSWYRPDRSQSRIGTGQTEEKDGKNASSQTTAQDIHQILVAIDLMRPEQHRDAETGFLAMNVSSGLVRALDSRLRLEEQDNGGNDQEDLPSPDALLGMIAKRLNANQQVQYLTQSRHIWKFLLDGALVRALDIDLEQVDALAKKIEETIDERFRNGRLELSDSSIHEILKTIEDNCRTNPEADEVGGRLDADKTLFRDPATSQQIAETEERLRIHLPDDYKEFMLITNGFGASFSGILFEPPLHPLSDLCWFDDDEDYFTDLGLDIPGDRIFAVQPHDADDEWVKVGKAIEVGTEDIDNQWLIPPSKMNEVKDRVRSILDNETCDEKVGTSVRHMVEGFAGSEDKFWNLDWGFVTWASGGSACMIAYPSFKAYLQEVARSGMKDDGDLLSQRKFIGYAMLK